MVLLHGRHPAALPEHHRLVPRPHLRRGEAAAGLHRRERPQPAAGASRRPATPSRRRIGAVEPRGSAVGKTSRDGLFRRCAPRAARFATSRTRPTLSMTQRSRRRRSRRSTSPRAVPQTGRTTASFGAAAAASYGRIQSRIRRSSSRLYVDALFTYADEVPSVRETYGRYLAFSRRLSPETGALLEIGCGSGFALEEALASGWRDVCGVEPTRTAVEAAAPVVRDRIVRDVMRPGLFDRLELRCHLHVPDARPHLGSDSRCCASATGCCGREARFSSSTTTSRRPSARVLGERSPSSTSSTRTCTADGRSRACSRSTASPSSAPAPSRTSTASATSLRLRRFRGASSGRCSGSRPRAIRRWRLRVPLGNLFVVAQKPLGAREARRS